MSLERGVLSLGASLVLHLMGFFVLLLVPFSPIVHNQISPLFLTVPPLPTVLSAEADSSFNRSFEKDGQNRPSVYIPQLVFPLNKLFSPTEDLPLANSKGRTIDEILPDSSRALKLALTKLPVAKLEDHRSGDLIFTKSYGSVSDTSLVKCLKSKLEYPSGLITQGLQADVELRWEQTATGEIDVSVVETSGFITVDDRVMIALRQCILTYVREETVRGSVRVHYVPERGF